MKNNPNPPKPSMAGFIRMIAESIAEKLVEDQKAASRALEKHETPPEPSGPPSVQGKESEGHFLGDVEPRPPPANQRVEPNL